MTTGGPEREEERSRLSLRAHYTFSRPPLICPLPPSACSHQSSLDLQYLHHPPLPIVTSGNVKNAPPLPALDVSQSMVAAAAAGVVGVPSHRARPPVGSLPCGGSDHSAVLTTRDLAPQPTVIEVTSQAIP